MLRVRVYAMDIVTVLNMYFFYAGIQTMMDDFDYQGFFQHNMQIQADVHVQDLHNHVQNDNPRKS